MPAIIRPEKWQERPRGTLILDQGHWAFGAIVHALCPGQALVDLKTGIAPTKVDTPEIVGTPEGPAISGSSVYRYYEFADSPQNSNSRMMVVARWSGTGATNEGPASKRGVGGQGWNLAGSFNALLGANYPAFGFFDGSAWRTASGTEDIRSAGLVTLAGGYDGNVITLSAKGRTYTTAFSGSIPDVAVSVKIGGDGGDVVSGGITSLFYLIDGNRLRSSTGAVEELASAPWQIFRKKAKILYFPSAGGGGATITPTGLSSSAFGSFSVNAGDRIISFTGKASEEAFGAFNLRAKRLVSFIGKSSDEAFGSFSVHPGKVSILLNSKTTDEAYGAHSLLSGQKVISPTAKGSDSAFGSFIIVSGDRILLINGVASNEAFGAFSINNNTASQTVIPSGYFDSSIGSLSLRPDQYIIFSGKEYLEFGQFLLSGSAVVRAMHFFDWIAQQPGLRGTLNDKLYQYLIAQGFTGSTPTMMFLWLRSLGYTGNTASMLTAFERDYTTRWY